MGSDILVLPRIRAYWRPFAVSSWLQFRRAVATAVESPDGSIFNSIVPVRARYLAGAAGTGTFSKSVGFTQFVCIFSPAMKRS